MGGRAQAWSMDLIIGVLIFMLAIGVIYALFASKSKQDIAPLRIESEVIATKLTSDPAVQIATNNQVDQQKLNNILPLTGMTYDQLKQALGVKDEFCVYFQDEYGNVTFVTDNAGNRYAGIGSQNGEFNLTCMKNCAGSPAPKYFSCGQIIPPSCQPC